MDLRMPRCDGVEATRRIRAEHPGDAGRGADDLRGRRVAVPRAAGRGARLSDQGRGRRRDRAGRRGACCPGDAGLSPSVQRRLLERLSDAEPEPRPAAAEAARRAHRAGGRGAGADRRGAVATRRSPRRLHVSTATVKTHINNLFAKTGVHDRAQAVRYAYAKGLHGHRGIESPDGVKVSAMKSPGSSRSVHPWARGRNAVRGTRRVRWTSTTGGERRRRCGSTTPGTTRWPPAGASRTARARPAPALPRRAPEREGRDAGAADVYLEVQRSAAFQEVRSRYRRFVFPGVAAFLAWYVAYVVTATTAPGLMARPVAGAVNVAMVAGLGAVPHHLPADLGVRPARAAAPGPGRARTALGQPRS